MNTANKIRGLILPVSIILVAALLRLVPHPANVAPIAAMALFGGVYLNKRLALALPLAAMLASDLFLGFHNTMPFVYGSFIITGFLGFWLREHKRPATVLGVSFLSSLLFFLITNFGVWVMGGMYPNTFAGLLESYFFALPFFRNSLFGDLLYTGLFFGGYEAATCYLKTQIAKRKSTP